MHTLIDKRRVDPPGLPHSVRKHAGTRRDSLHMSMLPTHPVHSTQCIHAKTMTTSMLPNHPLGSASSKPSCSYRSLAVRCSFFQAETSYLLCCLLVCGTYHHNGDAMLKHANMRKYRPCHAFPALSAKVARQTRVIDPKHRRTL